MVTVKEDPNNGRPTLTFEPSVKHTATMFFFHGLGDSSYGWREPLQDFAKQIPGLKIIAPTAPQIPVTLSGGMKQTAWCDLAAKSLSPVDLMAMLQSRPPMVEGSWVEILKLVNAELVANPHVPLSKMIFGGFSLGGHIASWVALQLPTPCAGILLMSGVVLGLQTMWIRAPVTNILHCHGTADGTIPLIGAQMIAAQMKESGLSGYELKTYEGMGHAACPEEIDDVLAFLKKCLAASPATADAAANDAAAKGALTICSNGLAIPNSSTVVIHSLKSKPQMNGRIGVITKYLPGKGRYQVLIEEESLALSPNNFRLEQVCLEGSGGGCLYQLDDPASPGACLVEVSSKQPLSSSASAGDLRFKKGAIVRLTGLKAGAPWNGSFAQVGEYHAESGRYTVDLGNKMQLNIKAENFTL
ncbi:unnamed protein product [Amoebophrya sp. A120]|nr:unnamed protein product [Amoebophrya sp. A120]|eukprot:GSA120T00018300001.1